MTNNKTVIGNDGMTGGGNPSGGAKTKSYVSEERRIQDALEDDEVGEALRSLRRLPEHPLPAK
jgi:hypothetical protein